MISKKYEISSKQTLYSHRENEINVFYMRFMCLHEKNKKSEIKAVNQGD